MPRFVFFLQIFAIVLYPLASVERAAASVPIPVEHISDSSASHDHHVGIAAPERQSLPAYAAAGAQTLSSSDIDMSACCCTGPVGLCLTLVSGTLKQHLVSSDGRVRPHGDLVFAGTVLSLIPHPPKTLS